MTPTRTTLINPERSWGSAVPIASANSPKPAWRSTTVRITFATPTARSIAPVNFTSCRPTRTQ